MCRLFIVVTVVFVVDVVFSIIDNDFLFRRTMLMLMLILTGWATVVVSGAGGVSAHRFMGNGRKVIGKEIRLVGGKA